MPKIKNTIERYLVLDRLFRNTHRLYTKKELLSAVCNELGNNISDRTLEKDILTMEMEYDVEFDHNLRRKHPAIFRYADPKKKYTFYEVTNKDAQKIQKAIQVLTKFEGTPQYDYARILLLAAQYNIDGEGIESVQFDHNPDLRGIENFTTFLGAAVNKQTLRIKYQPFSGMVYEHVISPYRLKQYNNRWFLLCQTKQFADLSCFPIDRIIEHEQVHEQYVDPHIGLDELFECRVGVSGIGSELPVEEVLLRVSNERYPYIETKPIHDSQAKIASMCDEQHTVIRLRVIINNELEQQILSFGKDIEVLQPESLRKQLKNNINQMMQHYL